MRIVMAANWWYRRGGLGAVMLDEADALSARGHEIVPFAAAHPDNLPSPYQDLFPPFLETSELGRGQSMVGRARHAADLIHNRRAAAAFGQLLDQVRPDIVHLHNTARQLSPAVLAEARRRNTPVVLTLHDYGLVCPQALLLKAGRTACAPPNCLRGNVVHAVTNRCVKGSTAGSLVAAVEHAVHRIAGAYTRRPTFIVVPSRFMGSMIKEARMAHAPIRYLANGLTDRAPQAAIPDRDGHVLYQGRLTPEKGLMDLLAAARLLPETRFVVAGDGPLRGSLMAQAPPNAEFVGHRTPDELQDLLSGAVAVISPSIWYENAPLAVLEGLRASRPVVATEIGGQPELLEGGGGLLVPPRDPSALAEAIRSIWHDRGRAREFGAAGRQAFLERFTLERHVNGLLEIYEAARRSPAPA